MKLSNQPAKTTNPGVKQVYRFKDKSGSPLADLIALDSERFETGRGYTFVHPDLSTRRFEMKHFATIEPLLKEQMREGTRLNGSEPLDVIRNRCLSGLDNFDETFKRIINPHVYKVSLSTELAELKQTLMSKYVTEI